MSAAGWAFAFFVVAFILDTIFVVLAAGFLGLLPPSLPSQQVTNGLIVPMEILDLVFVVGAIISGYLALHGSSQPQPEPF